MIWHDERLFEELSYVVPLGIPHSEFLAWDEDDQDKALAFRRAEREICSGCGTRRVEWEEDRFAYVGATHRCPGCEIIEQERRNLGEDQDGMKVYVVPRASASPSDEG